ncbi:hypothetical protein [Kitasatospora purpeofusca]|uniref:hypothetical protein n=1 Tax=Kitasatospora purpeofusca TaxID=67352 RepID=UPI0004C03471|nr:hypothetical protein [Kitasatospora purpeofusca]
MTQQPLPPAPSQFNRAQKDCHACINCGGSKGELASAGHVCVPDLPGLGWAVVAHPACRTAPEEEQ